MSNYREEFPDFEPSTMPQIPAGFEDISWRNDACPSFHHKEKGLLIYVDFVDPSQREFSEGKRFTLQEADENGAVGALFEGSLYVETDDWSEILASIKE